jgi:hypothetical protein
VPAGDARGGGRPASGIGGPRGGEGGEHREAAGLGRGRRRSEREGDGVARGGRRRRRRGRGAGRGGAPLAGRHRRVAGVDGGGCRWSGRLALAGGPQQERRTAEGGDGDRGGDGAGRCRGHIGLRYPNVYRMRNAIATKMNLQKYCMWI